MCSKTLSASLILPVSHQQCVYSYIFFFQFEHFCSEVAGIFYETIAQVVFLHPSVAFVMQLPVECQHHGMLSLLIMPHTMLALITSYRRPPLHCPCFFFCCVASLHSCQQELKSAGYYFAKLDRSITTQLLICCYEQMWL